MILKKVRINVCPKGLISSLESATNFLDSCATLNTAPRHLTFKFSYKYALLGRAVDWRAILRVFIELRLLVLESFYGSGAIVQGEAIKHIEVLECLGFSFWIVGLQGLPVFFLPVFNKSTPFQVLCENRVKLLKANWVGAILINHFNNFIIYYFICQWLGRAVRIRNLIHCRWSEIVTSRILFAIGRVLAHCLLKIIYRDFLIVILV